MRMCVFQRAHDELPLEVHLHRDPFHSLIAAGRARHVVGRNPIDVDDSAQEEPMPRTIRSDDRVCLIPSVEVIDVVKDKLRVPASSVVFRAEDGRFIRILIVMFENLRQQLSGQLMGTLLMGQRRA